MRTFEKSFDERLGIGRSSEANFELAAERKKLTVVFTSTHRDKPKNGVVRHFPDYFIVEWACFVQVKNGKRSGDWPSVIAEKASIDACKMLRKYQNAVVVVWEMPDGTFHGNHIEKLDIVSEISSDARKNGSGTPAYKISKKSLRKIL